MLEGLNEYVTEMASEGRREIVFISTDVANDDHIVPPLDPANEVFLIASNSDGIAQVAGALRGTTGTRCDASAHAW